MSSPSDDGQYTDTDKEELVSDEGKSDAEDISSGHSPVSPASSPRRDRKTSTDNSDSDGARGERSDSSSESGSNEDEDEEVRLRRKLLEKHNAAEAVKGSKEATSSVSSVVKKVEPRAHVTSISEDEEMFSIQPKETMPRQRSFVTRGHEERIRAREKFQAERVRRDRSKEERRRRHREKERDRREMGQGEGSSRRLEPRDDRDRHALTRTLAKEFSRIETRNIVTSRPPREERPRPRPGHNDIREERISHVKGNRKERSRSPRKRDVAVNRRSSSRERPAAKRVHVEKREVTVQEGSRRKTSTSVKTEIEEETVIKREGRESKTDVKVEVKEEMEVDEEKATTSALDENALPFKYSKFDSSPEGNDNAEDDHILSDKEDASMSEELATESPGTPRLIDSDDEQETDIMNMGEEELAKLTPDSRARIEEEQQRRLIAQLPAYYPGVSGCRSVAEFECLNRIEEGTFGVVYRAKEKRTDEIVALKRLKMEKEKEGFPITSLREINMLLKAGGHPNIVNVREIVVGSNMDKIYLVMEYIEHDMKSLMDFMHARQKHFTMGQVKTLMKQLLSGVEHMHEEWILHRDLKTSNLLLSHKGILKIGDFGLAREFGDPLKPYTPIVVTLWYRSPELLLGIKEYSTAVDMWSCGCIFAEFLKLKPLFPGKGELDQVNKIFLELGTPNDKIWPGYSGLPGPRKMKFEHHECNQLRRKFPANVLDESGYELMNKGLLAYDPKKRLSAKDALEHEWFTQEPLPTPPDMFPTWPAKSELGKAVAKSPVVKPVVSPKQVRDEKLYRELKVEPPKKEPTGFALKFDPPKFK